MRRGPGRQPALVPVLVLGACLVLLVTTVGHVLGNHWVGERIERLQEFGGAALALFVLVFPLWLLTRGIDALVRRASERRRDTRGFEVLLNPPAPPTVPQAANGNGHAPATNGNGHATAATAAGPEDPLCSGAPRFP